MRKTLYALLMGILLQPQCSYSKKQDVATGKEPPAWVVDPQRAYPPSMYLVGIGTGDTRADAENNAIAAIAKIFQSKVDVDETLVEEYLESKGQLSSTSQMLNKTSIGSNQQLKNVTIAKTFFNENEGLYYVLAYLDRMETEELYREEIEANNTQVVEHFHNFQQAEDKLIKFAFLQKAVDLMRINEVLDAQYRIIATAGERIAPPISKSDLERERLQLLQTITVHVNVEGRHADEIRTYLNAVIGKIGFVIVEDQADFNWDVVLDLVKADLNRDDMTGFNWNLSVNVTDNIHQYTLKSFMLKNRTMGISEDQAVVKMMNIIEKELNNKFYRQFMDYINSL